LCGECLADLWSLKLVVGVLKSIYAEATPEYQNKKIDGLDFWERFFIVGWAHSWREVGTPSTHVWMHAIPEVRCNMPLMNLPEFAEKFKLTEFNTMFLEPDQQVDFYC
jgi:predicted metalloendopeptidase